MKYKGGIVAKMMLDMEANVYDYYSKQIHDHVLLFYKHKDIFGRKKHTFKIIFFSDAISVYGNDDTQAHDLPEILHAFREYYPHVNISYNRVDK